VRWQAWYAGGGVYAGEGLADWKWLPDEGVLFVMVYFPDGTSRACSGDTWYFAFETEEGEVYAHSSDPKEELDRLYPEASFKRGVWVSEAEIQRVNSEATVSK
jgi:hypothetical protein